MIGEGPAAFFRDACQMMAKPSGLGSTTHVVGHLVREIESAMRASLATFAQQSKKSDSKAAGSGTHAAEIRAIAKGLGLADNDPALQAWLRLADKSYELAPHTVAHREALSRARPVTDEFERWWHAIQAILQAVLGKFRERFLEPLREVDRLLDVDTPSEDDVAFLKNNIPNNAVVLGHFFDKNTNPRWIERLNNKGFFKYPLAEGRWPQASYLARMAGTDRAVAEQICEIILALPDTENRFVRAELVGALRAMPVSIAARLIDKIEPWASDATGFLCEDFAPLIGSFAVDESAAAFRIANALLCVMPAPADEAGEPGVLPPTPRTQLDLWEYERILAQQVPELVKAAGLDALKFLSGLLSDAIRFSLREPEKSAPGDVSNVWRPAIAEDAQNYNFLELKSLLTRSVRDAALTTAVSDPAGIEATIEVLESREPRWRIFQRIVLYLLSRIDNQTATRLAADRLTNRDLFEAPECLHEYVHLLQPRFPSLKPEQRHQILGWIDGGLEPEQLEIVRTNLGQFTGKPVTDEDIDRFKKTWRRDWLQRLGNSLPDARKPELEALLEEIGAREHADFGAYHSEAVGFQSPLGLDEFKKKPLAEQVEYMRSWQPTDQFMGPSRAGLGEQLAKLVAEDPAEYATAANLLVEVDPTYQRFLLNGLREAVEKGHNFDWEPVFGLCRQILQDPIEIPGRQGHSLEEDPDRTWCRNSVATLLETALRQLRVPIPIGLKDELWKLLDTLSNDPNPTPEHEERFGGSNMDPAMLALNSTRGQAMYAVINYAWWISQSASKDENRTSKGAASGFETIPEARGVLEAHLDTSADPSLAIRAVYGQRFILLWLVDKQWATDNAKRIFPVDQAQRHYWEAAWSSYLAFSQLYWDVFEALRGQYALAVKRLATETVLPQLPIDPKQRLSEHVVTLFWAGRIASNDHDPIWEEFWSAAAVEVRKHALWYLGRLLCDAKDAPDEPLLSRLRTLWTSRLSVARAADRLEDYAAEIAQFGWWFCSEKFSDDWAFEQLAAALDFASYIDPDHLIFPALAKASTRKPLNSVQCLERLITNSRHWHLVAHEKELRQVLSAAKNVGGEAAEVMNRVVNALARAGMLQFRDLVA